MNAEIVARLEQSFREEVRAERRLPLPDQEKRLSELEQVVLVILGDLDATKNRLSALERILGKSHGS
jgi:hypothetical protein